MGGILSFFRDHPIGRELVAEGGVEGVKAFVRSFARKGGERAGERAGEKFTAEHPREAVNILLQLQRSRLKHGPSSAQNLRRYLRELNKLERDRAELTLGEAWWAIKDGLVSHPETTTKTVVEDQKNKTKTTKEEKSSSFDPVRHFEYLLIVIGQGNKAYDDNLKEEIGDDLDLLHQGSNSKLIASMIKERAITLATLEIPQEAAESVLSSLRNLRMQQPPDPTRPRHGLRQRLAHYMDVGNLRD